MREYSFFPPLPIASPIRSTIMCFYNSLQFMTDKGQQRIPFRIYIPPQHANNDKCKVTMDFNNVEKRFLILSVYSSLSVSWSSFFSYICFAVATATVLLDVSLFWMTDWRQRDCDYCTECEIMQRTCGRPSGPTHHRHHQHSQFFTLVLYHRIFSEISWRRWCKGAELKHNWELLII